MDFGLGGHSSHDQTLQNTQASVNYAFSREKYPSHTNQKTLREGALKDC
jgi:hypothetical protein